MMNHWLQRAPRWGVQVAELSHHDTSYCMLHLLLGQVLPSLVLVGIYPVSNSSSLEAGLLVAAALAHVACGIIAVANKNV